ncbi:MAG TPA: dihydrolipoamide acetyltransferase family protein, partial [Kofleriaceae bacterium]
MAFEFHLPDIGEGVVEGEIVAWKVKVGDKVKLDQPIVEIMTDKATVEIPSPKAGTIAKINFKDGDICPVGKVLVVIDEDGAPASKPTPTPAPIATPQAPGLTVGPGPRGNPAIQVVDATQNRERVLATPATRRLARQMGVELGRVPATGAHGRVTTDDVKRFGAAPAKQQHAPISIAKLGDEERIPLRGMRKRIAETMSRSVHTAAHFTYVEEVDMTELVTVRDRAKARAAERGVKLNYLPFIVKAVVSGLKKWPMLNASLDESTQEIVRKRYYHIGIAAQGPQGLAVSVVRDADKRSIFDLSQEVERLGEAVKAGTATRDELTGSTFTISSLGKLGGVLAT